MKALFLGNVAADTANGIRAELPAELQVEIVADPKELSPAIAAQTDILITNIWRAAYPPAARVRLVQSVATGIEWIEQSALPRGAPICNAYGHETAIAEYVLMVMLVWSHRFREIEGEFRRRSSWAPSWVKSGSPHGEIRGSTLGIVGLGRVGQEVATRAAAFGCHVLAANRSAREPGNGVERVYPLAALDDMLPLCDTVAICTAFGPETERLFDARRLARMKRSALLVNIARGAIVDEDALYAALHDGTIGGAAIDVWWQYPDAAAPERRGSHHPFHELPNVIMTPHCSGWTSGMVRRRWDEIAENLRRFVRGEPLINVVTTT
ncbi:MAG: phosphoglycerate dehydrogenase [Alphaproteobacteria bacterium]|nr:phosphoglycerate dehydrogenase [Alphaproteobacteria bacterium]MBV9014143.1 phosphoglycerate dehydrogenase [Alphaproteobacteria bacterium]